MQCPPPPSSFLHPTLRAHFLSYCFVWRPMSLFMIFFSVQCVRLETPVVGKLPWLSLKPRPNEIWMCREWIRVMEWAKYCLCGVSAILSWGDRYSGLRKVQKKNSPNSAHSSAGREVCLRVMLMTAVLLRKKWNWWEYLWPLSVTRVWPNNFKLLQLIYYAPDTQIPMVLKMQFAFNDLMKWVRTRKGTVLHKIFVFVPQNGCIM